MKKGQMFMYDLMFAMAIFIGVVFVFFHFWDQSFISISAWNKQTEMTEIANDVSKVLVMNKGLPDAWNETNVKVLGLVNEPNLIDNDKFRTFESMNFSFAKEKLNTQGYNLTIKLYNSAGGLASTIGDNMPFDTFNVVAMDNYVSKSGSLHNLRVLIWE